MPGRIRRQVVCVPVEQIVYRRGDIGVGMVGG